MSAFRSLCLASMAVSAILSSEARSSDCACKFPFKPDPPCFDVCWGRLLQKMPEDQLKAFVPAFADQIIAARSAGDGSRLSDYRDHLSTTDYQHLQDKLKNATGETVRELQK